MFSRKTLKLRRTLALRLTLWYASVFTACSALAFALVYALIVSFLQERIDLDLREDIVEYAGLLREGGLDHVRKKIADDTQGDEARVTFLRVWSTEGRSVMTSNLSSWRGLGVPQEALRQLANARGPILETRALADREYGIRVIYGAIGGAIAPGLVLEIGESMEGNETFIDALSRGFLITFGVIVALVSPVGWFLARRALRGVEDVTKTASEIAHGALERRVTVRFQGDEIERLAQTFNAMLDRIQALIVGMREMADNLAHDLRSPLARIRTAAEMRLTGGAAAGTPTSLAVNTIEECDRLLQIINTTLDISEAESGAARLSLTEIDLVALVHDACEVFQPVAEDRRVALATSLPTHCRIVGDRQRLQRAVANLLDNALKYTPAGGRVKIGLTEDDQSVRLSFEDTGIGISAEELPRIFQRFYRGDRSRSQAGNGLGLNLARAFVRAHGGEISVTSVLGQGSAFIITLARTPDGPPALRAPSEWARFEPEATDS